MLDQIRTTLAEIAQSYRDTRIYYCRLDVMALEGDRCVLGGTVLDSEALAVVADGLAARFPQITFDITGVEVLRAAVPPRLKAATNVTGLHAQPSFQSEMVNQLLNGWTVELLKEEDRWAFVSLPDHAGKGRGYLGWAYRPYLTDSPVAGPTHIVCEPVSLLRAAPTPNAPLVSRIAGGTAVHATVDGDWARLELAGGLTGWAPAADLRSLAALPTDEAGRRAQIVQDAARFIGVPYLWGGCTALGIDCSGFAQMLHRLIGVTIPRDADMQHDAGVPVEPPFCPGDLVFFGESGEERKITHVGVSLGGWRIIHSSRSRNGVYEDDVQAVNHLRAGFIGARTLLSGVQAYVTGLP